jgi:hypothetical protein
MALTGLAEVAADIGSTERWLAERVRSGRFPAHRVGRQLRFTDEDVAEIIRLCAIPAALPTDDARTCDSASSMTPTTARRIKSHTGQ